MQIIVNDKTQEVGETLTLTGLIEQLQLAPERLAVELNRKVIRRAEWPQTRLSAGDRVEIVHFVGGGCR